MDNLFEKLENYRIQHSLNVSELLKEIDISRSTYYDWKNGKPPATTTTINRIKDFLKNHTETESEVPHNIVHEAFNLPTQEAIQAGAQIIYNALVKKLENAYIPPSEVDLNIAANSLSHEAFVLWVAFTYSSRNELLLQDLRYITGWFDSSIEKSLKELIQHKYILPHPTKANCYQRLFPQKYDLII